MHRFRRNVEQQGAADLGTQGAQLRSRDVQRHPLIGQLFRQKRRSNSDTQLLIFITPTLVSEHANQETTAP